jgi:hypothetical protein
MFDEGFDIPFGINQSLTLESSSTFTKKNVYEGWVLCRYDELLKTYYLHPILGYFNTNAWIQVDYCVTDIKSHIYLEESEIELIKKKLLTLPTQSIIINTDINQIKTYNIILSKKTLCNISSTYNTLGDEVGNFLNSGMYERLVNDEIKSRKASFAIHLKIIEPIFLFKNSSKTNCDNTIFKGKSLIIKIENSSIGNVMFFARPIFEEDDKEDQNSYYNLKNNYKNIKVRDIIDIPYIDLSHSNFIVFQETYEPRCKWTYYIPKNKTFINVTSILDNYYYQCKEAPRHSPDISKCFLYKQKPTTEYDKPVVKLNFPKSPKKTKKNFIKAASTTTNIPQSDVNTLPETTTTTTTSEPVSKNTNVNLPTKYENTDIKVSVSSPCSVGIVEIRFNDEIAKFHLINNKLPVSSICSRFNLRYFCIDGVVVSNDYYGLSHLDFNNTSTLSITC